jgi:GT2 family glycosyltransferase
MIGAASDYKPGVDLVVVNYRTPTDLAAFLSSLVDAEVSVDHSLTVANVDPLAGDRRVVQDWKRKVELTYLEFASNVGYATAVNRGLAAGRREVCVALNADVALRPGALEACHGALMDHDDWGVLGPCQVDGNGRFTHAGIFGTLEAPKHRGWLERDTGQYRDVVEAVTVSGSAYFARRSVWEELASCPVYLQVAPQAEGAFLPTQHYFEETWASYHAQAHGWKVVYFGPATMTHLWHRASPVGGEADRHMQPSREFFRQACDAHWLPHD